MSFRSIEVQLQANVGQFRAQMGAAGGVVKDFGRELTGMGESSKRSMKELSAGALIAGGALALGFGKGIAVASSFSKEMSSVRAVSSATATEMRELSQAALDAGESQQLAGVTARDAARAETELVKAGVSVSQILDGALMGSLTLASAGQLDFADAATIAAQAMNLFDLGGNQVAHIADVLAAAANKSAADVSTLGQALQQGGLVASQTGLSLEETVGALAAFADSALVGSDAGTSLKSMLQRLTPQSQEARRLMEQLGFSAYDAAGNFIGLEGLAGELQDSLANMTVEQRNSAMATLFGSDAVRAANVLYSEGADGIAEYVQAVNDQGAAARMAAIQNDNLAGDIEALGGAIETTLIENGGRANGMLRVLIQSTAGLVSGFSAMPGPVQATGVGLGAVATAGLLTVGALGTMYPKLADARRALNKMGTAGSFLAGNLTRISGGLAIVGAGVGVFAAWEAAMSSAAAKADEWSKDWRELAFDADGLDEFKAKLSEVNYQWSRLNDDRTASKAIWDADYRKQLDVGIEKLEGISDEMSRVVDLSDDLAAAFGISGDAAMKFVQDQQAGGLDILALNYDKVRDNLLTMFSGMSTGTIASQTLGASMGTLGSEIASVEDQVDAFSNTLDALYSQMFGLEDAHDALQTGLNELPSVLRRAANEGLSLNGVLTGQSQAAIDVRGHMRGVIQDASALVAEWREQGITGEQLAGNIRLISEDFREQAEAAGLPAPVIDHYLNLLSQIPADVPTKITADTSAAEAKLRTLKVLMGEIGEVTARPASSYAGPSYRRGGLPLEEHAQGGLIEEFARGGAVALAGGGPTDGSSAPADFVLPRAA